MLYGAVPIHLTRLSFKDMETTASVNSACFGENQLDSVVLLNFYAIHAHARFMKGVLN